MASGSIEAEDLLQQVSRSFFLTLRILPRSIKRPIGLAYLLARAADTVADTPLVDPGRRRSALVQLRKSVDDACEGRTPLLPDFGEFAAARESIAGRGNPAERSLLENVGALVSVLRGFAPGDRLRICTVMRRITHGQELDLIRFGAASEDQIAVLGSDEELDGYTHDVAGCVGEFWTEMCRAHVFPKAPLNDALLLADAVRFGKGLQLVNILRDLPRDLRQGRCYLPQPQLSKHGLKPSDLLDAGAIGRFRPLYEEYLERAEEHLRAGWRYILMLPFGCLRIRLACAWPVLIGARTIQKLRRGNILDRRDRIRIRRAEVWALVLRSAVLYPYRPAWNRLFDAVGGIDPALPLDRARDFPPDTAHKRN
jgi:farnesyl-diphosphate farnesyltransferase